MKDPLKPDAQLLIAIGSAIVHAEEFMSPTGHPVDKQTFESIITHSPVKEWLEEMQRMCYLPLKRDNPAPKKRGKR